MYGSYSASNVHLQMYLRRFMVYTYLTPCWSQQKQTNRYKFVCMFAYLFICAYVCRLLPRMCGQLWTQTSKLETDIPQVKPFQMTSTLNTWSFLSYSPEDPPWAYWSTITLSFPIFFLGKRHKLCTSKINDLVGTKGGQGVINGILVPHVMGSQMWKCHFNCHRIEINPFQVPP